MLSNKQRFGHRLLNHEKAVNHGIHIHSSHPDQTVELIKVLFQEFFQFAAYQIHHP